MIDAGVLAALRDIAGPAWVSARASDRDAYARDMYPKAQIWFRQARAGYPPEAIVWPADAAQTAAIIRLCAGASVPVTPFGAGSGVCGGAIPLQGGITLDTKRMNRMLGFWPEHHLARYEVGIVGELLERDLARRGFTLGHFPSSIYCSCLGGWLAARSAGQMSSKYGKIEDMVASLRWIDGLGNLHDTALEGGTPAVQCLVGTEGTVGTLVDATLRIRPQPTARHYRGFRFHTIARGLEAMRLLMQSDLPPAVLRLYDEFDTFIVGDGGPVPQNEGTKPPANAGLKAILGAKFLSPFTHVVESGLHELKMAAMRRGLRIPGLLNAAASRLKGCLLIVGYEGRDPLAQITAAAGHKICLDTGGSDLGEGPGLRWLQNRYGVSYKQSAIFASGAFVDTMEVATTWRRLEGLYKEVVEAVSPFAFIMAHFSHAYPEGCSIYFTFAGAGRDDTECLELYDRMWALAQAAAVRAGATFAHHHGVGFAKQARMAHEHGDAMALLRALKATHDPAGIMNPGKLAL